MTTAHTARQLGGLNILLVGGKPLEGLGMHWAGINECYYDYSTYSQTATGIEHTLGGRCAFGGFGRSLGWNQLLGVLLHKYYTKYM